MGGKSFSRAEGEKTGGGGTKGLKAVLTRLLEVLAIEL